MLILLAPSERKDAPRRGRPVDLEALAFPALTARRDALLRALEALAAGPRDEALSALGLSEGLAGEVDRDGLLRTAPARRAAELYTGVLYEHLDLASLSTGAKRRAGRDVLVASGLWGVVALGDRIPAYRLSMGARLDAVDAGRPLAAGWRPLLADALPDEDGDLVVDLRSGSYAAAWAPKRATRVEVGARDAQGRVVSHMVKATRGAVARRLLEAPRAPRTPEEVAALAPGPGEDAELLAPTRRGGPWSVVVRAG